MEQMQGISWTAAVGWSELKEVLRVKSHAEVAKILLDYC
jgi:hypothetical protein